ncbi:MAG: fibronectin type III domain-containing protein [Candidatus Falkowbacteria bacterium]
MQKEKLKNCINILIFFTFLLFFPFVTNAATVLTENFTGTTIDTNKWTEYDAGGIGGTTGNVQQNDVLSITGDGTWNHNGLKSVQTFDRSKGDIIIEGDWQLNNSCASDYTAPSLGVIYGDMISGFNQEDGALSLIYYGGSFRLFNTSGTFVLDTQVACIPNTTVHYKFVVKQAGGVDVYLNGSLTPNGSMSAADAPNTYTNKPISLQQKSGGTNPTISLDNITVSVSDSPSIPANLAATPASGQVTLNWTAPSSVGSALTDYQIEYKLTSEPTVWTTYGHAASTSTSVIVGGLLNGESYDFRVSGINGMGTGSPSDAISSTPNLYVSSAPYDLVSSFGSNNHINLSWTAPLSNGGASITDYLVEYKLSTEPTVWTTFVDGVSTSTSATVVGLTSDMIYDFRVSAINSVGTGPASNTTTKKAGAYLLYDDFTGTTIDSSKWTEYDSATGGSGGTTGKVQQNGAVDIVGTFAWNTNALKSVKTFDRSTGDIIIEGDWTINDCSSEIGENSAISFGDWVTNGTVVNGSLFFKYANGFFKLFYWPSAVSSEISCTSGVPTHIKEVIRQAGGMDVYLNNSSTAALSLTAGQAPNTWNNEPIVLQQSNSSGASFDNLTVSNSGYTVPDKTTGLTATPRDNQVELSWITPADGGDAITDYLVQYKLSSEPTTWITFSHNVSTSTTNFVTGLISGSSYDFKVSAVNINGVGPSSDSATATPIQSAPSAPQNLSAGNAVSNQIDLTWEAPVSNGGKSITNYLVEYKLTSEPTFWTTFAHGVSTTTNISVTGLTNGVSYDFRVSAVNSNGSGTFSSIVTIPTVNSTPTAPIASEVNITGQSHVSEYLLGSYIYSDPNADPEGATTFRWLSSNTLGGTYLPISGATSTNYTVRSEDLNNYLKLEVTPVSTIAPFTGTPVLSNAIGPITAANYIYHILSTGQSLSLGYAGSPVLSTTQPYNNKMLDGTDTDPGTNLVPLVESSNETPASAMGNGITFQNGVQTVVTRHGVGGTAYQGLKKGTAPYENGIQQMINVRNAATLLGKTSQVMGITTVHGETDNVSGNSPYYEGYLAEWQRDYEADIKAINGQSGTIPMFTDQMDSWTTYGYATSSIPEAQLAASEDYPGKIVLVGPKYFLTYATGPHLTDTSYRMLGEYYAKVMKKVFFDKVLWRPLSPDSTQLIGNVIYAKFHVPEGVLAFDTNIVKENTNYGFEYYDNASSATISSVSIMNSDTVKITLSNIPTGGNQRLRYAYTGVANATAGAQSDGSPRGNLRDTDPEVSLSGSNLYDWAVHFDKAITSVTDTTSPVVTQFNVSATSSSLTVPIGSFTASDDYYVTGYLLTESSSTPLVSDAGWSIAAPTSYIFSTQGPKTLYAWAKDAAGNISASMSASLTVTINANAFTFTGPTSGNVNSTSTIFTITPNNYYAGTITVTPSGSGSSGLSAIVLNFSSAAAQTFTITPASSGTITLTPTNSGGLTNPANIVYTSNEIPPDDAAPVVSLISASSISTASESITWLTNILSSSRVDYGLTDSYGSLTAEADVSPAGVVSHTVVLSGLVPCTTYHYSIYSNSSLNLFTKSSDNYFTTSGCVGGATIIEGSMNNIAVATGGNINLITNGQGINLVVPINFGVTDANFQIKKLNESTTVASTSVPVGYLNIGSYVYEMKALSSSGTVMSTFDNPLTVSLTYTPSDVSGKDETSLKIYRWDGVNWNELSNCSVDTNLKKVTCSTNHFSVFGLFGRATVTYSGGGGGGSLGGGSSSLCSITYDGNGSISGTVPTVNYVISGSNIILADNKGSLTRPKYVFSGWNTTADGSGTKYSPGALLKIESNIKLYSQWILATTSDSVISNSSSGSLPNIIISPSASSSSTVVTSKTKIPASFRFTKNLKFGLKDKEVLYLQYFLINYGYDIASPNSYFGVKTKAALIKFQKDYGLSPEYQTGAFYVKTRELVNNLLVKKNISAKPTIISPSASSSSTVVTSKTKIPASFRFTKNLKFGLKDKEVLYLQYFLINYGYDIASPNSYFGVKTKAALIKFQKDYGLSPEYQTGAFYVKTRELVNNLLVVSR